MKCPFCNKEIESNSAFCEHCGQIITTSDSKLGEADVYWNKENSKRKKLEEEYQKQEKQFELLQKYRIKKRRNIIISIVTALTFVRAVSFLSKPPLIVMGISTTKMFLIFEIFNEPKKKCDVLSAFRIQPSRLIYLKLLLTKLKIYFSFLGWYITFSLIPLSIITCEFYGGSVLIFGTVKTYSFAGFPLP